jgi:hypothetical protein
MVGLRSFSSAAMLLFSSFSTNRIYEIGGYSSTKLSLIIVDSSMSISELTSRFVMCSGGQMLWFGILMKP